MIRRDGRGVTKVDATFEDDDVWLSSQQIADLFQVSTSDVNELIHSLFHDRELTLEASSRQFDGVIQYNLDVVNALGFRINSSTATRFRQWASGRLKEYLLKGFTMDDERLKGYGSGNYWRELLGRIREIRSSDKVLYRQVLDLYATSTDYDPESEETKRFFRIMRDKLHFATHGHTAAEVIYQRADADKPMMGLTAFSGKIPILQDVDDANNYLTAEERKRLGLLVSGYFDLAEAAALKHEPMTMKDHIAQLDRILSANGEEILEGSGNVSLDEALERAHKEYRKYQVETVSPVEQAYLETISDLINATKGKGEN